MSMKVAAPFQLGETLSGTDSDGNLINTEVIGKIFTLAANDMSAAAIRGSKARRTSRPVVAIAVRNTSGIALLGKHLARLERTAGYRSLDSIDGYADLLADAGVGVIDEFLPSAGVADDDICWLIVSGPVTILTPFTGAPFNGDISVGDHLVAATAATTQGSDAGRVSNVTLAAQTAATVAFQMARNGIGKALSAKTTGNTDEDLLVDVNIEY